MKGTIAVTVLAAVIPTPARAQIAGGVFVCANCATEPTQLSVKVLHDLEYARQLLQ